MLVRGHAVGVTHAGVLLHDSRSRRIGLAAPIKTLIVAVLCRVSWQRQATLAWVVRWIWPGFRDA